jgi:EmrB/QacA subfamily drug resistance transporter
MLFRKDNFPAVVAVAIGTFMSSLDASVVNVALPVIQNGFRVPLSTVEWVVTAYLLVTSSLLLPFGKLSDIFGHKKVYITGFVVFSLGSLACGLSTTVLMLILCRAAQALGAGMMFSAGPAVITGAVSPERRGKAFSISAVTLAVALCTGPVLGGALATAFGWRSIFFINLPIGAAGVILAVKTIPGGVPAAARFDWAGSLLIFAALSLILLPLQTSTSLPPAVFFILLGAGITMAALFIAAEKKSKHPLLHIDLFKRRVFTAGNLSALLNFTAQFIMIFLAPFYLEKLRHFSPTETGLLYLPMPLATMCVAPVSGIISDRFDNRYISAVGMAFMAAGLFMLSWLASDTPAWYIISALVVTGTGSGLFQTPNNSAVMGCVPPQHRGAASGALAAMRNVGMVMGVAISGALFSFVFNQGGSPVAMESYEDAAARQPAFLAALQVTFLAAAAVALLAMIVSLLGGKSKGSWTGEAVRPAAPVPSGDQADAG